MIGPDESMHYGSAGLLAENLEAKIVDPVSGKALSPGQQGELWIRGPTIMSGDSFSSTYFVNQISLLSSFVFRSELLL